MKSIKPFKFKIRALVVDKERIRSTQLKRDKHSFYSYFIKMVLRHNKGTILNAKVKIDGSGDRVFRRNFLTYLRKELNTKQSKVIKNLRLVDSKSNVLIQLSDMIAGSIRRYKEGEKGDAVVYWEMISDKISNCWDFR